MIRALVTGGCGFIGQNFIRRTLASMDDITIINFDKLSYAADKRMVSFQQGDRYQFIQGDLAEAADLERIKGQVDWVIHFAAESHVDRSIEGADPFIRSNIVGTHHLLEFSRKRDVRRYLQVSTDEVYGSMAPGIHAVEDQRLDPSSPYSASKASADLLVRAAYVTFGMPVMISRCSNNFGSFQFPEKFIPVVIRSAMEDKKIPVYGDGKNTRDWLFVTDHCDALLKIMKQGRIGEIYNIGAGEEWANLDLARCILDHLKKPHSLIDFVKDRLGHDRRYAVDCSKISSELGWKPAVSFEQGMKETVRWYCAHIDFLLSKEHA